MIVVLWRAGLRITEALALAGTDLDRRTVEGCDFIHVNGEGLIDEPYVMFRPVSGLMALAEAMKRRLALPESTAAS